MSAKDLIKRKKSNIFNCGYGKGYSVKDVIIQLNKILKNKIKYVIGPRRRSDSEHVVADTKKFINYFSWKPKHNNLKYILEINKIFKEGKEAFNSIQNQKEFEEVLFEKNNSFGLIESKINTQIERTRSEETSPKNTTLYFLSLIHI